MRSFFFQIHYVKIKYKNFIYKKSKHYFMEDIPSSALSRIALGHISFFQNSVISNRDMWDPHVLVHAHPTHHH